MTRSRFFLVVVLAWVAGIDVLMVGIAGLGLLMVVGGVMLALQGDAGNRLVVGDRYIRLKG